MASYSRRKKSHAPLPLLALLTALFITLSSSFSASAALVSSPLVQSASSGNSNSKSNVLLRNMAVLSGSVAELQCDTVPAERGDEVILVLWFRENVGTPIFSADAREVALSKAGVWYDDDILKKRATFKGRVNEPSVLAVANVSLDDQSIYRCRVDFREAKSRNARINLTVIEPPKSLVVTTNVEPIMSKLEGPYRIGDRPKFTCTVQGGVPVPTVVWRRNKVTVSGQLDLSEPGIVRSTLFLAPLKRSDWPMTLTCSATNWDRGRALEQSIQVDMELPPLSVAIVVGERNPAAGRSFSLPCHAIGSRPAPKITWWRNDQLLESASNRSLSINGNVTVSVLDLTLDRSEMGSKITCRAVNPYLDSTISEDIWIVDLSYPPNVSLAMGRSLNAEGIKAGDDVYFDCHVDARPSASRIEWRRNGVKLVHNMSANVIITNQSLVLQNVGRNMAGNISCAASNVEGHAESNHIMLDIKYSPVCRPGLIRHFGVSRHENVEVACQVEANPVTDMSYKWFLNNSAETIEVPRHRYNNNQTTSLLSYKPAASLDYGTLLCYATNSAGAQQEPCVFHILTAGPPEPVFNCTVSNHSTDAVLIVCQPGFHGGLPQNFSIDFYEDANSSSTAGGAGDRSSRLILHQLFSEPVFLLSSLKTNMRYKAFIGSFNAKGKSDDVVVEISTMKEPERQLEVKPGKSSTEPRTNGQSFLTPTLGILSALVVLLFIAGVIAIVFLRRQCQREGLTSTGVPGEMAANCGVDSAPSNQNGTAGGGGGASIISKTRDNGASSCNPRSQSLKPLMESVDCDMNAGCGPMLFSTSRMDPTSRWEEQQQQLMFNASNMRPSMTSQLSWPVGEPPPHHLSAAMTPLLPPPSGLIMTEQPIETGLITPPYTRDGSLELRSPDIIPPPVIGSCDFGPATLPRSYKGYDMAPSSSSKQKSHVTWSDTMPKVFRQSHEFLRRETSSGCISNANKRESVV